MSARDVAKWEAAAKEGFEAERFQKAMSGANFGLRWLSATDGLTIVLRSNQREATAHGWLLAEGLVGDPGMNGRWLRVARSSAVPDPPKCYQ